MSSPILNDNLNPGKTAGRKTASRIMISPAAIARTAARTAVLGVGVLLSITDDHVFDVSLSEGSLSQGSLSQGCPKGVVGLGKLQKKFQKRFRMFPPNDNGSAYGLARDRNAKEAAGLAAKPGEVRKITIVNQQHQIVNQQPPNQNQQPLPPNQNQQPPNQHHQNQNLGMHERQQSGNLLNQQNPRNEQHPLDGQDLRNVITEQDLLNSIDTRALQMQQEARRLQEENQEENGSPPDSDALPLPRSTLAGSILAPMVDLDENRSADNHSAESHSDENRNDNHSSDNVSMVNFDNERDSNAHSSGHSNTNSDERRTTTETTQEFFIFLQTKTSPTPPYTQLNQWRSLRTGEAATREEERLLMGLDVWEAKIKASPLNEEKIEKEKERLLELVKEEGASFISFEKIEKKQKSEREKWQITQSMSMANNRHESNPNITMSQIPNGQPDWGDYQPDVGMGRENQEMLEDQFKEKDEEASDSDEAHENAKARANAHVAHIIAERVGRTGEKSFKGCFLNEKEASNYRDLPLPKQWVCSWEDQVQASKKLREVREGLLATNTNLNVQVNSIQLNSGTSLIDQSSSLLSFGLQQQQLPEERKQLEESKQENHQENFTSSYIGMLYANALPKSMSPAGFMLLGDWDDRDLKQELLKHLGGVGEKPAVERVLVVDGTFEDAQKMETSLPKKWRTWRCRRADPSENKNMQQTQENMHENRLRNSAASPIHQPSESSVFSFHGLQERFQFSPNNLNSQIDTSPNNINFPPPNNSTPHNTNNFAVSFALHHRIPHVNYKALETIYAAGQYGIPGTSTEMTMSARRGLLGVVGGRGGGHNTGPRAFDTGPRGQSITSQVGQTRMQAGETRMQGGRAPQPRADTSARLPRALTRASHAENFQIPEAEELKDILIWGHGKYGVHHPDHDGRMDFGRIADFFVDNRTNDSSSSSSSNGHGSSNINDSNGHQQQPRHQQPPASPIFGGLHSNTQLQMVVSSNNAQLGLSSELRARTRNERITTTTTTTSHHVGEMQRTGNDHVFEMRGMEMRGMDVNTSARATSARTTSARATSARATSARSARWWDVTGLDVKWQEDRQRFFGTVKGFKAEDLAKMKRIQGTQGSRREELRAQMEDIPIECRAEDAVAIREQIPLETLLADQWKTADELEEQMKGEKWELENQEETLMRMGDAVHEKIELQENYEKLEHKYDKLAAHTRELQRALVALQQQVPTYGAGVLQLGEQLRQLQLEGEKLLREGVNDSMVNNVNEFNAE